MPNPNAFLTQIRKRIAENDVKTAIQQVSAFLKGSPLLDEAIQQSARYNNVMKQIRLGIVDFQAANVTQNQITDALLALLREIEAQEKIQPNIQAEVERYAVKNPVKDSTINAGGHVTIGDTAIATQQNHTGSGDNVAGDKISGDKVLGNKTVQHIHLEKEKPPRFLTQKPFQTDFFIGRDPDLAAINQAFSENNRLLVLVNGEGGMGKTTLAAQYWFRHEKRYQHLAWMFAGSGIANALLNLADNLVPLWLFEGGFGRIDFEG